EGGVFEEDVHDAAAEGNLDGAGGDDALDDEGGVVEVSGDVDGAAIGRGRGRAPGGVRLDAEVAGGVGRESQVRTLSDPVFDPSDDAVLAAGGCGDLGQGEEPVVGGVGADF